MYRYLKEYIKQIDILLEEKREIDCSVIEKHLVKISFFQHERKIHLLVTLAYALFLLISIFFILLHPVFAIIPMLLICWLLPYVIHYFHLENGVQYLYRQYDRLLEKYK